ncbi:DUF6801 domain-containing protein [Streptomyces sp. NPDC056453]|uniref:DUF6801 domain-containing protein n=1 Tax=unclassified Streptomyces TaxID=2593676 RepID=UPI0036968B86
MSSRCGKGRMGIILRVATALVVASGMAVVLEAGTASAQVVSPTFAYTCSSPVIGDQPITARIDSDMPRSVAVGAPGKTYAVNAEATVGASFTQMLVSAGMQTLGGTAVAKGDVAAPQGHFGVTVPFAMARTSIPASGSFLVRATASATTPTFTRPGKGKITAGALTLNLVAKNADGSVVLQADPVPCTLNPGQNDVVMSFDVTKPTPTAGSAAPTNPRHESRSGAPAVPGHASGSAAPATATPTTGSVASPVPKPTTPHGAGPTTHSPTTSGTPSPRASGTATDANSTGTTPTPTTSTIVPKASTGSQDTEELTPLAVGVLVACAAAFRLGMWLKDRRHTADEDPAGEPQQAGPKQGLPSGGVEGGRLDMLCHRESLNAAAPQHRGSGGSAPSRRSEIGEVTVGRSALAGRHAADRTGHHSAGGRAGGGTGDCHSAVGGVGGLADFSGAQMGGRGPQRVERDLAGVGAVAESGDGQSDR